MSNFFYRYSDYSSFSKAFKDCDGEDVVVDILSTDESLKESEIVESKHIMRKDNRFSQESSFNRFFGPRRNINRNFDMKDFSSWKNKNYRETEKQIGEHGGNNVKFSFSDFMNERSGGKTYNDADQNKSENQKAINELSTDDPTFKRFSLNDYMRRLEEKTRVNNETRDNEDLIDSIGDITQDVTPDSSQDENFDESFSNFDVEKIVDDETFVGDKYSVDKSELDAMNDRLKKLREQTEELNKILDDVDDDEPQRLVLDISEEDDEVEEDNTDDSFSVNDDEQSQNNEVDENDSSDESSEDLDYIDEQLSDNEETDDLDEENKLEKTEQTEDVEQAETINESGDLSSDDNNSQVVVQEGSETGENQIKQGEIVETHGNNSQEIVALIEKNDNERKEIEEKLKQAEKDKEEALQNYESRVKELEKSIEDKDKEKQETVLQERIKSDNMLSEMKAAYESREAEIRRLEKEAALKMKIGALLKKELKNNLSISDLEMNNKLLEISALLQQEKEKAKVNKPKTTRKRKQKRRIDSDIVGNIDFD